jgi:hypothetical protein
MVQAGTVIPASDELSWDAASLYHEPMKNKHADVLLRSRLGTVPSSLLKMLGEAAQPTKNLMRFSLYA